MRYKVFPLIPRVRVNFKLSDLVRSLFVSESENWRRQKCEKIFNEYFDNPYFRNSIKSEKFKVPE